MGQFDSGTGQKPTVNDIARVAGVSLATVDRVLNARPGVRDVTIQKVNKAIAEIGYVRDTAAANLARRRLYKLRFVLPDIEDQFFLAIKDEISSRGANVMHTRTQLETSFVPAFDPSSLVDVLDGLSAEDTDGVALFGPDSDAVRAAVARLQDKGIAVVSLISDLPDSERDHFVGIDNVAAGRTAARLMGGFVHGNSKILMITGSRMARDHADRRVGFEALMKEDFPRLEQLPVIEGLDDANIVFNMLTYMFDQYDNIGGIYASAAGNEGLIRFLKDRDDRQDLVVIAHELTATTRPALAEGLFDALISQDVGHLVRSATRLLKATLDRVPFDKTQERIRIDVYVRENLP